jgi:hypothetical protein
MKPEHILIPFFALLIFLLGFGSGATYAEAKDRKGTIRDAWVAESIFNVKPDQVLWNGEEYLILLTPKEIIRKISP